MLPVSRQNDDTSHWCRRGQLGPQPMDANLRRLLFARGSLTRHLQRHCATALQLQLLAQRWQRPCAGERRLLGLAEGRFTLVREVSMNCRAQPLIYARTLLPPQALRGAARRFISIGERPLGALLFGAPGRLQIRQLQRDYARLAASSSLHRRVNDRVMAVEAPLWARRTLYRSRSMHFAIIEIFLPAITGEAGHG